MLYLVRVSFRLVWHDMQTQMALLRIVGLVSIWCTVVCMPRMLDSVSLKRRVCLSNTISKA